MTNRVLFSLAAVASLFVLTVQGLPAAAEESSMNALLRTLNERGVISDAEHAEIAAKNEAYEERQKRWLPKIHFWGDVRTRFEGFWFDEDPNGSERPDRFRGRVRLRLNGKVEVNDRASVFFRLTSGGGDPRSTNRTLGDTLDFDSDPIAIDLAYAQLTPFPDLEGSSFKVDLGKVKNPFRWKRGKDLMLWDGDITLEGVSARLETELTERIRLFANTGYYIDDENGAAKDPHLWAGQLGAHVEATDELTYGGRVTYYRFASLNSAFVTRAADSSAGPSVTSGGGNIPDGLTGDPTGSDLSVIELGAYLGWSHLEGWPVLLYANWSQNLDAESSELFPGAGRDDSAWGVGFEVGDKKKYALLGVGYWRVEANAFPSMFIDSDLFDGITNRKGFAFYGSRQLRKSTDLRLTVFKSQEIEDATPAYDASLSGADRVRLRADIVFGF